ncbi:expressed unknown protein [Seminavis robusta]|uniref:Uncharacterized protein n=1 Tax=Seminavis robusta TaxID=568900 RepID=A0A9N8HSA9_9STRA|nr:expressed unknown protein [Seminavis robusta]|eukprot:Sro1499_g277750.1 n/a (473) ;mRNA; f:10038-11456
MEFLDWHHFQRDHNHTSEFPPNYLIHEKYHETWHGFFQNSTDYFEGKMTCDCRRSEQFSPYYELEDRYYANVEGSLWATYIQGYGDYYAHGRYMPKDIRQAHVSPGDGPNKDTTPFQWNYEGKNWDKLFTEFAAQLEPRPTSIVLNAGHWPHQGITRNMESILRAVREVIGWDAGHHVIYRATVKSQYGPVQLSSADQAARDWSLRMPGILFQPFPPALATSLTPEDYFDDKHFAHARTYRQWNQDLVQALTIPATKVHRVFILSGAVRTLQLTKESLLHHWMLPLCPPSTCVAHLVTHFSYTDNRPNPRASDPRGSVVESSSTANDGSRLHFQNHSFPEGYLVLHPVEDGYNIGSQEEKDAMDLVERETGGTLAAKMRIFRVGDPRRYSMWFARAWTWRHVQQSIVPNLEGLVDFYAFTRPDMLYMIPVPTVNFFREFRQRDQEEVWVHDTYYAVYADTFAFFETKEAGDK